MLSALENHHQNDKNATEPDAAHVIRHLAHELRQPLSTLESLAYYLNIILPAGEHQSRQQIEKIQTLIRQANGIINDAVYFTQASAPNPSAVTIDQLISEKITDCERNEDLNLHFEVNSNPCVAWVDENQLTHALSAVLDVFRRIIFSGSRISIRSEEADGKAEVRISSTVATTRMEEFRHLIEIPEQSVPGDGWLSFASVRSVIRANDGDLQIESGPDQQVAFCFRFPVPC